MHKKVGPEFFGETFRVLKEKEEREFTEYRTIPLALEAGGNDGAKYSY